ncbi:uncharacterized protein LOC115269387 [Aedes albopictus]|uniref:Integrase zinc-binding domain-containing protein n=1 Tax=Aedes albopictus TaxID=7160 RepID=A0ABM2A3W6_AEDAL|nr:uncharacterized protein LOC115269387 [Aedes albopictus]
MGCTPLAWQPRATSGRQRYPSKNAYLVVLLATVLVEQNCSSQCLMVTELGPMISYEVESYLLNRFSSLKMAQRVLAWINRFKSNLSAKMQRGERVSGELDPLELHEANLQLVRCAQHAEFQRDIQCLKKGDPLASKSQIKSLFPFLDGNGTLRVGGRLQNSDQPFEMKHPMILPKVHRYTELLITALHIDNLHAGPTLVIATLNQKYWILGCQAVVRTIINNCVRCTRWKAKTAKQLMGSLPTVRIAGGRAFENVGVDYAGPICRNNMY